VESDGSYRQISDGNPLIPAIVMLAVFLLYWFAAKRPLKKLFGRFPPLVDQGLRLAEGLFWTVTVVYAVGGIIFGIWRLLD
jgi:hypothetical protein